MTTASMRRLEELWNSGLRTVGELAVNLARDERKSVNTTLLDADVFVQGKNSGEEVDIEENIGDTKSSTKSPRKRSPR